MSLDTSASAQIQEFVGVLKRRRWQIVLPALFVFTFGTAFAVIVPKKYVVTMKVQIVESRNIADPEAKNTKDSAIARELVNAEDLIKDPANIEEVVGIQLAELWPEYAKGDADTRVEILRTVAKNLTVTRPEKAKDTGSTFLTTTYEDVDQERAEAFLTAISTMWLDEIAGRTLQRLEDERDGFETTATEAAKRAEEANRQWTAQCKLVNHNPSVPIGIRQRDVDDPTNHYYAQLNDYLRKLETKRNELVSANSELKEKRDALATVPESVLQKTPIAGDSYAKEIAALQNKVVVLQGELASRTPANAEYKKIEIEIARLREGIAELERRETEVRYDETPVPNPAWLALQKEIFELEQRVRVLTTEEAHFAEKAEELQDAVHQANEEFAVLGQLWLAKVEADEQNSLAQASLWERKKAITLEKQAESPYAVSEWPKASDDVTRPSFLLLTLFSALAGLALGLCVAVASEYARNGYRTVGDLAGVMTVPVLGAIQTISTRAELRRNFLRRLVVGGSSAVILLGVAWLTYVWQDEESQQLLPPTVLQAIDAFRLSLM